MGSPAAGLAAFWAAGLAALFVEGLARGLAAFGAGFAGGLGGGSSPYGKQFALGTSHVKYNVPWAKTLRLAGIFQALQKCVSQRGGFTIELHNVCLIKEGQDKIIQVQLHLLPRMPPL
eukprot:CAMPEP_0174280650 /NCGR_PEP_ID=MMETSP0809-20121228/938_1 /TAXON_ID=73025 ORGANISM="Eutreptiella gymnastica-like, Strain CCMP1594" /NCGR_SAMPLE_ID=MMETSP0809 /ASSEMBLY_ACC=CAM_ASM_000658 /LENGTH=117 /DNA_ID=CAMNT_0015373661 /DNA_START=121 /DNA_END=474 /DNA_ORIENTATION=-